MPFTLIKQQLLKMSKTSGRSRRSLPEVSFDSGVYIDEIAVPRGVPDEFKARNQILAGLESGIFWWSTINKNVDWINYIYYNQQRFINYSRDANKGLAEQTAATSLMAWKNRMALDMLLAEKGALCGCCIIPCVRGLVVRAIETSESNQMLMAYEDNDLFPDPGDYYPPELTGDDILGVPLTETFMAHEDSLKK
uniref:Uncharacterized protein n=1 Tax=Hucho hucho TaxID=62062 RepID=A0A4W5MGN7_9TELE